jgi:hypothetical protein
MAPVGLLAGVSAAVPPVPVGALLELLPGCPAPPGMDGGAGNGGGVDEVAPVDGVTGGVGFVDALSWSVRLQPAASATVAATAMASAVDLMASPWQCCETRLFYRAILEPY